MKLRAKRDQYATHLWIVVDEDGEGRILFGPESAEFVDAWMAGAEYVAESLGAGVKNVFYPEGEEW